MLLEVGLRLLVVVGYDGIKDKRCWVFEVFRCGCSFAVFGPVVTVTVTVAVAVTFCCSRLEKGEEDGGASVSGIRLAFG